MALWKYYYMNVFKYFAVHVIKEIINLIFEKQHNYIVSKKYLETMWLISNSMIWSSFEFNL